MAMNDGNDLLCRFFHPFPAELYYANYLFQL